MKDEDKHLFFFVNEMNKINKWMHYKYFLLKIVFLTLNFSEVLDVTIVAFGLFVV